MIGSVEIKGLDRLDEQLAKLNKATSGKILYNAVSYALAPMQAEAKKRAPRAERAYRRYMSSGQGTGKTRYTKTGKKRRVATNRAERGKGRYQIAQPGLLRKSIRRRQLTKGVSRKMQGVTGAIYIAFPATSTTFNSPFYWHFIEHGTSQMPATPFLRPAFFNNTEVAVKRFSKKLAENIDKTIK